MVLNFTFPTAIRTNILKIVPSFDGIFFFQNYAGDRVQFFFFVRVSSRLFIYIRIMFKNLVSS